MPIVETLALGLGAAVAKSILAHWLEDNGVALTAGTGLVDAVRSVAPGVIEQRRCQRQFEEIANRVAEDLVPLFQSSGLSEDRQRDIAWLAEQAIEMGGVNAASLLQRDLDPGALARHFINSQPKDPHSFGFSKFELQLYQAVVSRSAAYVVDIASELPLFTERSIAEILKRESQIIDIARKVLAELERIRGAAQRFDDLAVRFEAAYREVVVRNLDRVELFGVDVSTISRRQKLSVAYVSLLATSSPLTQGCFRNGGLSSKSTLEDPHSVSAMDEEDYLKARRVEDFLAQGKRLVIRGAPGCGKTTLLQWIAVRSAGQTFSAQLEEWNTTIPFFIALRKFVDSEFPRPEHFPGFVARTIAGQMPNGWVHKWLKSGNAVVLIDGVDELPERKRAELQEWLKELIDIFGNSRFIVTSRPGAIEEGWMAQEGFAGCEVQPMDLLDIQEFIKRWHAAVKELLQAELEVEELERLECNLQDEIRTNLPIRNLATIPLLCAVICALHRDRKQQLPSDRIEVYEACCNMLIERRDIERRVHLDTGAYPRLSYRRKRALLEDLAYWMMRNSYTRVTTERVDERFDSKLADITEIPQGVTGTHMRRYLVDRSGIIREPTAGEIDFAHLTFEEFLAAHAAVKGDDIGFLMERAADDRWRETIILAAGLARTNDREKLIKGIIERGDKEATQRHQLHLLAMACLETAVELGQELRDEVQKRLSSLVPPKNMREAKALASAGELAVPFLQYDRRFRAAEAKACVHALAQVGGAAALNGLKTYIQETRRTVFGELINAADSFDPDIYKEEVLSKLASQERRALEEAAQAGDIGVLARYIIRAGVMNLSHKMLIMLSPQVYQLIAQLTNLQELYLSENFLISLPPEIGQLTNLQELDLAGNRLTSLPPEIGQLTNLKRLALSENSLTSLPPEIGQLTNLQELYLYGNRLTSLPPEIGQLTNLWCLNLAGNRLTSLPPEIGQLTNLTVLLGRP